MGKFLLDRYLNYCDDVNRYIVMVKEYFPDNVLKVDCKYCQEIDLRQHNLHEPDDYMDQLQNYQKYNQDANASRLRKNAYVYPLFGWYQG